MTRHWTAAIYHTGVFNLTGHPSVVIPLGLSSEGLPIGVQIVGRRWADMVLLDVAEKIAEKLGSPAHPPGYES